MVSRKESELRKRKHQQAMQRYKKDRQRNVLAKSGIHDFVVVLDNLKGGFNPPKIFRSAETFGASAVHLINVEPFDPSPAKGAFRKVPARFHENFAQCYAELNQAGYQFFTLEADCQQTLHNTPLPAKSAFILGNEELGICFDKSAYENIQCLSIPQFGQTESLNVSIAASIVMYEYTRQHTLADAG